MRSLSLAYGNSRQAKTWVNKTIGFDELKECQGILVCSDLAGGSPFKTAVEVGFPRGNVEVVAGSNLPMLIEVNMGRQFVEELGMLTDMAVNTGKDQVMRYEFKPVEQAEPTDGI